MKKSPKVMMCPFQATWVSVTVHFECWACGAKVDRNEGFVVGLPINPTIPDGWFMHNGNTVCPEHAMIVVPVEKATA